MTSFLDLPPSQTDYDSSKFVIVPFPMERSTSYLKGTAKGPQAIIDASTQIEFFDSELLFEPCEAGIHTMEPLIHKKSEDIESCLSKASSICLKILEDKKIPIFLGGEHTITVGAFKGFESYIKKQDPHKQMGLLQIDAHADLREEYLGDPYSHACAMRRVINPSVNLAAVGIRSVSVEEWEFVQKNANIMMITDPEWHGGKPSEKIDQILSHLPEDVYISIDLDGLCPELLPAVGTPEPGGFAWHELLELLRAVFDKKKVHAFDVNELMPLKDLVSSNFVAAKLVYKMIAYAQAVQD